MKLELSSSPGWLSNKPNIRPWGPLLSNWEAYKDGENSLICSVIHKMGQSLSHKQAYEMSLKMKNKLWNHKMGGWASQKAKAQQVGSINKLTKSL